MTVVYYTSIKLIIVFVFQLLLLNQMNASHVSTTYVSAVVSMKAITHSNNAQQAFYLNTKYCTNLINHIFNKSPHKPDIIIFPEEGLQGDNKQHAVRLPDAFVFDSPCDHPEKYDKGLTVLSCAAKHRNVYLVVNLAEKHTNSSEVSKIFNTNVVFDRRGKIIERYRKMNVVGGYDVPSNNQTDQVPMFYMDSAVQFGLFTGIDLLCSEPYHKKLKGFDIDKIIHPTKWINSLPFGTASEIQFAWAYQKQVTLLSAGYNDPTRGYGGTGVYAMNDGLVKYSQPESSKAFTIIARLPKTSNGSKSDSPQSVLLNLDEVYDETITKDFRKTKEPDKARQTGEKSVLLLRKDDVEEYTSKLIEPVFLDDTNSEKHDKLTAIGKINEMLCSSNKKFCCTFHVEMITHYELKSKTKKKEIIKGDNFPNYYYRLAVFDGKRKVTTDNDFAQICGIIPCIDKDINSCAIRTDDIDHSKNKLPVTIEKFGNTYVQVGTTFNIIRINTEMNTYKSDVYPLILKTSDDPKEFGSLPGIRDFEFTYYDDTNASQNNTELVAIKMLGYVSNLASIGIYNRIYVKTSATEALHWSFVSLTLPLIHLYNNLMH